MFEYERICSRNTQLHIMCFYQWNVRIWIIFFVCIHFKDVAHHSASLEQYCKNRNTNCNAIRSRDSHTNWIHIELAHIWLQIIWNVWIRIRFVGPLHKNHPLVAESTIENTAPYHHTTRNAHHVHVLRMQFKHRARDHIQRLLCLPQNPSRESRVRIYIGAYLSR